MQARPDATTHKLYTLYPLPFTRLLFILLSDPPAPAPPHRAGTTEQNNIFLYLYILIFIYIHTCTIPGAYRILEHVFYAMAGHSAHDSFFAKGRTIDKWVGWV